MRVVCPSCGAIHSLEGWQNDADMRKALQMVADLPKDVSRLVIQYLSLFRTGERGLRWQKVLRLLAELQEELNKEYIQWDKKVARPNSHKAWGLAMEKVLERADNGKIKLPLESHGYLKSIAYDICNEMDKKGEIAKNYNPYHKRTMVEDTDGFDVEGNRHLSEDLKKTIDNFLNSFGVIDE